MYDNLPQQETINQYTADGSTTVFSYTYLILLNTDIAVYVTAANATPNPNTDIKILNVDYTVTGATSTSGGTVVFTTAPASGSTVTLLRNMQISINTDFAAPQTLNGQNLDDAFERVVMIEQELETQFEFNTIKYPANSQLGTDPTIPQKTLMAIPFTNGDIWMWNGTQWVIFNINTNPPSFVEAQIIAQLQYLASTAAVTYNVTDNTCVAKSVGNYIALASHYVDSGSPNHIVPVRQSGQGFTVPNQLYDGLILDVIPLYTNTTAVTVTFGGETLELVLPITGVDLQPGFIQGITEVSYTPVYRIIYSASNNKWIIVSTPTAAAAVPQVQSNWTESDNSQPDFIKNKPTIPAAQVNADWNAMSGVAEILNKPPAVTGFSFGSYESINTSSQVQQITIPGLTSSDAVYVQYAATFGGSDAAQYFVTGVNAPSTGTVDFFTFTAAPAGKLYNYLVIHA